MQTAGFFVLLCIALIHISQADWENEPEWSFQVYPGKDVDFICNDTSANVMEGDVLEWKDPHGKVIMMDNDKYTLTNHNNVARINLKVKNVQEADHGIYLCFISRNSKHYTKLNRAVNYKGPLYENLVEKYETHIMIGGIAAAALFVPLVVMCLIYKYRYMTNEEKAFEKEAKNVRKMTHSHDIEAGPLPVKQTPRNGGQYNPGYSESTNL